MLLEIHDYTYVCSETSSSDITCIHQFLVVLVFLHSNIEFWRSKEIEVLDWSI